MSIGAELGQYILQTQFKKILKIHLGEFERPLGTPVGLPKATARVDSRLKLTFNYSLVSQLITCDKLTFNSRCWVRGRVRVRVMVKS